MNTEFIKFRSITNTYQNFFIQRAISWMPVLSTMKYVVMEKIHGANIQIAFEPINGGINMQFGRRKEYLEENESFNGLRNCFSEMLTHPKNRFNLGPIAKLAHVKNSVIRLYGEFFGDGIAKGVNYFPGKKIKFFAYSINGIMMPPADFFKFMFDSGNGEFCVPIRFMADNLKEALDYDTENCITILGPHEEKNFAEGVVIAPYNEVIELPSGKLFFLKKKHSKFAEKKNGSPKVKKPTDSDVAYWRGVFSDYLTDNRLQNVFSKEGKIEESEQIGKYIQFLLEDAKEDFFEDYGEEFAEVEKSKHKQIFNAGRIPADLIKEYL